MPKVIQVTINSYPGNNFTNCTKQTKIYLNVPYGEKDEAKGWGARWDAGKKKWFIDYFFTKYNK